MSLNQTTPDIEARQKRALYRAQHRGTKELDLLLGQFVACLFNDQLKGAAQSLNIEQRLGVADWLIAQPDHALQPWLIDRQTIPDDLPAPVIVALQAFDYQL